LSIPVGSVIGGLILAVFVLILKWLIIRKMKPGNHTIWGANFLAWELLNQSYYSVDNIFIKQFRGTPLFSAWLRLLGAKVGNNCFLAMGTPTEPDLVTIGDDVVADDCTLIGHHFDGHAFRLQEITIGNGCAVGMKSVMLPGSTLREGVTFLPLSVALVGEEFPPNTTWGGSLAELVSKKHNSPLLQQTRVISLLDMAT